MPYQVNWRKIYLLAMFLQRPNELFKFDYIEWNVVFDEIKVFTTSDDDTLRLYKYYIQLQIKRVCSWTQAMFDAMNIILKKEQKVNWGRDGF